MVLRAGRMVVSGTEFHRKWVAQCEAAKQINADRYAEFAQEPPHFLDGIRGVFSLEETGDYVDQLELTRPLSPPQRRALRAISSISSYIH